MPVPQDQKPAEAVVMEAPAAAAADSEARKISDALRISLVLIFALVTLKSLLGTSDGGNLSFPVSSKQGSDHNMKRKEPFTSALNVVLAKVPVEAGR